jgi:hypothetical protein
VGVQLPATGDWAVGFKVAWQHTGPTSFATSLPGEFFKLRQNDMFLFGVSVTTHSEPSPRTGFPVM